MGVKAAVMERAAGVKLVRSTFSSREVKGASCIARRTRIRAVNQLVEY